MKDWYIKKSYFNDSVPKFTFSHKGILPFWDICIYFCPSQWHWLKMIILDSKWCCHFYFCFSFEDLHAHLVVEKNKKNKPTLSLVVDTQQGEMDLKAFLGNVLILIVFIFPSACVFRWILNNLTKYFLIHWFIWTYTTVRKLANFFFY